MKRIAITTRLICCIAVLCCQSACAGTKQTTNEDWIELFNGRDLDDWAIKIQGAPLGENRRNTFRVADGLLSVRYDEYTTFPETDAGFGHIFYTDAEFSHYILEVEYRFVGEQATDNPQLSWAYRNNGMMYHTQSAESMALDQDFPLSMEYQLLGGNGKDARSTANLCTPGTQIVMAGELRKDHCINSNSASFHGDQWVTVRLEVHGSDRSIHSIDGQTVMEYTQLQQDDGTPRAKGYIALQAETAPIDFRKVRLLNLVGCMDKTSPAYRDYFVEHDAAACRAD